MSDEAQGWIERVAQLQATLDEGYKITAGVIGPTTVAPLPDEAKEPDSMAARLSQNLERAINDAVQLVEQIRRIREQF